jgi:outer membrane protein TolC
VPNSQNPTDTSNPTVAKLLEADAFLATSEAQLSAQLQLIQEKRHSLKTVIDLFAPTDTTTVTPIATPAQTPVAEAEVEVTEEQAKPSAEDVATPELALFHHSHERIV